MFPCLFWKYFTAIVMQSKPTGAGILVNTEHMEWSWEKYLSLRNYLSPSHVHYTHWKLVQILGVVEK